MRAAAAVLRRNDRGSYTLPSQLQYPHQWNWDSALISLGWAAIDPERAYLELETLAGTRDRDGMLPHIAFDPLERNYLPGPSWWGDRRAVDGRPVSGISQPPVAATCLRLVHERHPRRERVRGLLEPLHAWHRFLVEQRGAGGDEPVMVHPWETGRDNAVEWDAAAARVERTVTAFKRRDTDAVAADERPATEHYIAYLSLVDQGRRLGWDQAELARTGGFRVLDPGFSAALAAAAADLAVLADEVGDHELARESRELSSRVSAALAARAAGDGLVYARDLAADEDIPVIGSGTALALLDPALPPERVARLRDLVLDGALASPFGVRSLEAGHPDLTDRCYWRGPCWANVTWLCALGLRRHGEPSAAEELVRRMRRAAEHGGLREYFSPDTGQGFGARGFSWTAALLLHEDAIAPGAPERGAPAPPPAD